MRTNASNHCVDDDFLRCDIPIEFIDRAFNSWMDFKASPASWDAFERFEWAMKLASIKFDTYATNRRIEASREP